MASRYRLREIGRPDFVRLGFRIAQQYHLLRITRTVLDHPYGETAHALSLLPDSGLRRGSVAARETVAYWTVVADWEPLHGFCSSDIPAAVIAAIYHYRRESLVRDRSARYRPFWIPVGI